MKTEKIRMKKVRIKHCKERWHNKRLKLLRRWKKNLTKCINSKSFRVSYLPHMFLCEPAMRPLLSLWYLLQRGVLLLQVGPVGSSPAGCDGLSVSSYLVQQSNSLPHTPCVLSAWLELRILELRPSARNHFRETGGDGLHYDHHVGNRCVTEWWRKNKNIWAWLGWWVINGYISSGIMWAINEKQCLLWGVRKIMIGGTRFKEMSSSLIFIKLYINKRATFSIQNY